ncbi:hypothetical protein CCHL11_04034 [Colletotrichum chlorophyti]|uniref:Uncharacterized protein n=1 Tax=Colletotrichum chlorophyti TaxID=708187 RepID=A0A1Q8RKT4_9PEZI|nr:hypothetical protein CCHL11_04034 [Colletotrichum chlorophyti]
MARPDGVNGGRVASNSKKREEFSRVRSHDWISPSKPPVTTEARFCPCIVYARTAERLERAAYGEDPLDIDGGCNVPCVSCFLGCLICQWKKPVQEQRGDIRARYAISGTDEDDDNRSCAHPFSTLVMNENEVIARETICKDLGTNYFGTGRLPKETRRFKCHTNSPYKSPPQMEKSAKSLPSIIELPECTSGQPRAPASSIASPTSSPEQPDPALPCHSPLSKSPWRRRMDTPAGSPDVLRSPDLSPRDPHVTVADFVAPHRLSQDAIVPVGNKTLRHGVHDDVLFGIAEEVHPHTVHDDPKAQVARRISPHQISMDPKVPSSITPVTHSVHDDPPSMAAGGPTYHSVHADLETQIAEPLHNHRLSYDPVAPVTTRAAPHSIHDDQTIGTPGRPAAHRLSGDVTIPQGETSISHSVHKDPMVKVAGASQPHAMHTDARGTEARGKSSPRQAESMGTAPEGVENKPPMDRDKASA